MGKITVNLEIKGNYCSLFFALYEFLRKIFPVFFYTARGALKIGWCREATFRFAYNGVCTEQPERPKKWGSHRKFPQKKKSERPKSHLCFPGTQLAQDNPQLSFHCCIKSRGNPMDLKTTSEKKK